jgi:ribonuclease HI
MSPAGGEPFSPTREPFSPPDRRRDTSPTAELDDAQPHDDGSTGTPRPARRRPPGAALDLSQPTLGPAGVTQDDDASPPLGDGAASAQNAQRPHDFFPDPVQYRFCGMAACRRLIEHEELMNCGELLSHFDGACRGNNSAKAADRKGAIGAVFANHKTGEWFTGWGAALPSKVTVNHLGANKLISADGNNRAEFLAAIDALHVACELKKGNARFTQFTMAGDSAFVVAGEFQRNNRDGLSILRAIYCEYLRELQSYGVNADIVRVPRAFNRCADGCCNAALDRHALNTRILAYPPSNIPRISSFDVGQLLTRTTENRTRTERTLTAENRHLYHSACVLLVQDAVSCGADPVPWLMLAPHIFLRHPRQRHRTGRAITRTLLIAKSSPVARITLIRAAIAGDDPVVLEQVLPDTRRDLPRDLPTTAETRVHGHLANICPAKALLESESSRIMPNDSTAEATWRDTYAQHERQGRPEPDLPTPLEDPLPFHVEEAACHVALFRTKRGASPGFSGWTRETMTGIFQRPIVGAVMAQLLSRIINDEMPDGHRDFLNAVPGICFRQNETKVRTCGLRDYLMKLAWRVALQAVPLSPHYGSYQMMGKAHGSALAARWLQAGLDEGRAVATLDAQNAHPLFSREETKRCLLALAEKDDAIRQLFNIWNFTYTHVVHLLGHLDDGSFSFIVHCRTGMMQGCVSAGPMFSCLQHYCITTAGLEALAVRVLKLVADDGVVSDDTPDSTKDALHRIGAALERGHIFIRGQKNAFFSPEDRGPIVFAGGVAARVKDHGTSMLPDEPTKLKPLRRFSARIDFILSLKQLNHQDVMLLALHVSSALRYFLQATHPAITGHYRNWIKERLEQPFLRILECDKLPPAASMQLSVSFASAGLGVAEPRHAGELYNELDDPGAKEASGGKSGKETKYQVACRVQWEKADHRFGTSKTTAGPTGLHLSCLKLLNHQRHWARIFPTSRQLQMTNSAVTKALRLQLAVDDDRPQCVAPEKRTHHGVSRHAPFLCHLMTCGSCASSWRYARHQAILRALKNSAERFDVHVRTDVGAVLAGMTEETEDGGDRHTLKRPDAWLVMPIAGVTTHQDIVMMDVTVVHHSNIAAMNFTTSKANPLDQRVRTKKAKYEQLLTKAFIRKESAPGGPAAAAGAAVAAEGPSGTRDADAPDTAGGGGTHAAPSQGAKPDGDTGGSVGTDATLQLNKVVVPIILNGYGMPIHGTVEFLEQLSRMASRPGLVPAVLSEMQVASLNAQALGIDLVQLHLQRRRHRGVSNDYDPQADAGVTDEGSTDDDNERPDPPPVPGARDPPGNAQGGGAAAAPPNDHHGSQHDATPAKPPTSGPTNPTNSTRAPPSNSCAPPSNSFGSAAADVPVPFP